MAKSRKKVVTFQLRKAKDTEALQEYQVRWGDSTQVIMSNEQGIENILDSIINKHINEVVYELKWVRSKNPQTPNLFWITEKM